MNGVEQNRPKPDEPSAPEVRLAISLRLKAARFLAGGLRPSKKGMVAGAMTVDELAEHPLIQKNGIATNRLEAYEQMKVDPPKPMELEVIAEALGVNPAFLLEPLGDTPTPLKAVDETLSLLSDSLKVLQDQLPRLGRDIGRRDLEWHPTRGRLVVDRRAAA